MKVVIIVDNGVRDLLSCRLLQEEFRKRSMEAYLSSKRNMKFVLRQHEPDVVIVPRADLPYLRDFAKSARIYVVPCEGGRLTLKTMMSVFLGRVHGGDVLSKGKRLDHAQREIIDFNFIRRVYLWGPQTYTFLKDSNYFNLNQLTIAGTVKLDIYRNIKESKKTIDNENFVLGVAFSAKATSSFEGRIRYAELFYGFDERAHLPMVPAGRHWEDYAWRDFAMLRRTMNILKKFLETCKGKVYLRVNPFENPEDYAFLVKKYPGRVFIRPDQEELYEFLTSIDVLLTCWSTTGLESLLCKVPVIAIPYLMDKQHLFSHVDPQANGFDTFLPCYHLPETEDQAIEMIEQARKQQLKLTPNEDQLNKLLREIYGWPSEQSAAYKIVEDILKDFRKEPFVKQSSWNQVIQFPAVVNIPVNAIAYVNKPMAFGLLKQFYQGAFLVKDIMLNRVKGYQRHHMEHNSNVEKVIQMVSTQKS